MALFPDSPPPKRLDLTETDRRERAGNPARRFANLLMGKPQVIHGSGQTKLQQREARKAQAAGRISRWYLTMLAAHL